MTKRKVRTAKEDAGLDLDNASTHQLWEWMLNRCRQAYSLKRRTWAAARLGVKSDYVLRGHDKEIARFARKCLFHNVSPELVCQIAFNSRKAGDFVCTPAQLVCDKYYARTQEQVEEEIQRARQRLRSEAGAANKAVRLLKLTCPDWPASRLFLAVVLNACLPLSPLTRYVIAKQNRLNKAAKFYSIDAVQQLLSDFIVYTKAYGRCLPEEIIEKAARSRRALLRLAKSIE